MNIFSKKESKGIAELRACERIDNPLPTCAQIHPSMPLVLQAHTVGMCEKFNISIWDRDKLWSKLTILL